MNAYYFDIDLYYFKLKKKVICASIQNDDKLYIIILKFMLSFVNKIIIKRIH